MLLVEATFRLVTVTGLYTWLHKIDYGAVSVTVLDDQTADVTYPAQLAKVVLSVVEHSVATALDAQY